MKIVRPPSSPPPSVAPKAPSEGTKCMAGQGGATKHHGSIDPSGLKEGVFPDLSRDRLADRFHRGELPRNLADPCASGSSVRGMGGGHSGTVACDFALPNDTPSKAPTRGDGQPPARASLPVLPRQPRHD